MTRRHVTLFISIIATLLVLGIISLRNSEQQPSTFKDSFFSDRRVSQLHVPEFDDLAKKQRIKENAAVGLPIMAELGNATLRAELGRSTWHLLHTVVARFPSKPTEDESEALRQFTHLLARLYPCGECAKEFTEILKVHPPQTGGRVEASQWACEVHNLVNKRLEKDIFDCATVTERWKCGCADEGH